MKMILLIMIILYGNFLHPLMAPIANANANTKAIRNEDNPSLWLGTTFRPVSRLRVEFISEIKTY